MNKRVIIPTRTKETQPIAHKVPCKNCPSAHYPNDPETQEIIDKWPRDEQVKSAFACGWNQVRFCRGYCDKLSITTQDLITLCEERKNEPTW